MAKQGPTKAVRYAWSYWQFGVYLTPGLAVLRVLCLSSGVCSNLADLTFNTRPPPNFRVSHTQPAPVGGLDAVKRPRFFLL